ncbi:MAG: NYN domain-containing protein [Patescibacteria group bacterium]
MGKAIIFIDGSNFYFRLKDLESQVNGKHSLLEFDFRGFAEWLTTNDENKLVEVRYYVGALKRQRNNEKSEKMYANQQRLLGRLQQQKIPVVLGQLIQHPDKTFHEKGVDVRLAVEMIRLARENMYEVAYLVSSDTDLVAAIEEVQSFGKKVQYIGTAKSQSFGLAKAADDVRLLRAEDIKKFLPLALL